MKHDPENAIYQEGEKVTYRRTFPVMRGARCAGTKMVEIPCQIVSVTLCEFKHFYPTYTVEILEKAGGFRAGHQLVAVREHELRRI